MPRTRVSTTVDEALLTEARAITGAASDASLFDQALAPVTTPPGRGRQRLCSAVNLDSVESVSIGVLVERLCRLGDDRMREVCGARSVAVDCR